MLQKDQISAAVCGHEHKKNTLMTLGNIFLLSDVEKSMREQRPIKVQCGTDKRSLYDPVTGWLICFTDDRFNKTVKYPKSNIKLWFFVFSTQLL